MTGNQLKILALVTMTIDHVGVVLLPQYLVLRIIGRLTYPIFAYMIAEGCFYTHSKRRYLGGIFALGVACQLGFFIAMGSLEQSILTTFVFAIITIYALQSSSPSCCPFFWRGRISRSITGLRESCSPCSATCRAFSSKTHLTTRA